MDKNSVQVSIICNAFNQEGYIRKTLDSFLMQKTDFQYEILIHDDASTDGTAQIIREYAEKYPEIVKPMYQTVNQYSQRIGISENFQYPRVQGKYIAFCEGDDYWTDPLKLQKQYDALETHPDVDICTHAAVRVHAQTEQVLMNIAPRAKDEIIPVEDVIMGEGGYVATNSIMFRARINDEIPVFRKNFPFDYSIQIHGSLRGGMLYLSDYMAAYRYMSVGSWTSQQAKNAQKRQLLLTRKQKMLQELDADTNGRYHDIIAERMLRNEFEYHYQEGDYKTAFQKKYSSVYKAGGMVGYAKLRLKASFPFLNGITMLFRKKHKNI